MAWVNTNAGNKRLAYFFIFAFVSSQEEKPLEKYPATIKNIGMWKEVMQRPRIGWFQLKK